ncbi:alpha/beta fold hydrolase [Dactylosporangium sp. CS-047395]|uniref:alpha/beta fold hydrolase n=1 Tax=Dactylosporangium sp. CS-047395 TaxID=3239936 RepID=UPI003D8A0BA5
MYSRKQGTGEPMLVVVQGGDGDADATPVLVEELARDRTVMTYDRRGLSRSPAGDDPVTIESHTDDLALLLATQARGPVDVLGISIGGLIGLDLAARYPGLVRTVVAYEPPLTQVMDDPEPFVTRQRAVEEAFRAEGVAAAMQRFLALTGFDPADREPDVELPRPGPERAANLAFFLTHDAPAARRFWLYESPLLAEHVVPAAGASSRGTSAAAPVEALAKKLGRDLAVFEGGHNAHVLRPRAFAATVRSLLGYH